MSAKTKDKNEKKFKKVEKTTTNALEMAT